MRHPLIICSFSRIVIAPEGWFDGIGSVDVPGRKLRINVNRLGEAGLSWILDADGLFFSLKWIGLEPRNWLQFPGLKRRVEVYEIGEPRSISNDELAQLAAELTEQLAEAPNSEDLRKSASARGPESFVTREQLRIYLAM